MARRSQIVLIDDITGEEADETVFFGLDGVEYSIDLTQENAAKLRAVMDRYVSRAERIGGRRKAGTGVSGKSEAQVIREWADEQGIKLSARGRIPASVRELYYNAQA
ncbi:MAG: Lsr2 family protein [Actinomycetaceae bacterium]|nr:Lsr2 family protein [Actinomycetaceae bacterium]